MAGIDPISNVSDAVGAVSGLVDTIVNKIWPNPEDRAKADALRLSTEVAAYIDQLKAQLSIFLAEATSSDPWTSRARPSFMYVMYAIILAAIPMGVVHAFSPETATAVTAGFKAWMDAIPSDLKTLFGLCFGGYTIARSYEKVKGASK